MVNDILEWIRSTALASAITESTWLFPSIETVHVMAITLVVGSIAMVDLRLLNVSLRNRSVIELTSETLPWTWASFCVAVVSGSLLFISAATKYAGIWQFQMKMIILVLAGLNMMYFHFFVYNTCQDWHLNPKTPVAARIAGAFSLIFWISVVTLGRWIGFVEL